MTYCVQNIFRPLTDLVSKLHPFYKVDCLLPRVLAATLKVSDLPLLEHHDVFSPEIYLGLLYYHVKTLKYPNDEPIVSFYCVLYNNTKDSFRGKMTGYFIIIFSWQSDIHIYYCKA